MSDWTYVSGETSYNQDFQILNQETNEPIPLSGTVTMFITSSDFVTTFPSSGAGVTMTITDNQDGTQVARLAVNNLNMPQDPGIFIAQIKLDAAQTFKTFLINLRVVRSITN